MPLFKYTLLVGTSLLALIAVADFVAVPTAKVASDSSTSFVVLKKMANHGEVRGFAPLADAGAFLPMPVVAARPVAAVAEAPKPVEAAAAVPPAIRDAQAQVAEADVVNKPPAPAKKMAHRKPKPQRNLYVANIVREPTGFFDSLQSW